MADPERKTDEPFQVEVCEKELKKYMQGAEIGSAKLLALSDELRERDLNEMINYLEGSRKKANILRANGLRIELALLRHQTDNRVVEMKGYANASDDVSRLVSSIQEAHRRQGYKEGVPHKKIDFYLDDTYRYFIFTLFRSLTIGEEPSEEK